MAKASFLLALPLTLAGCSVNKISRVTLPDSYVVSAAQQAADKPEVSLVVDEALSSVVARAIQQQSALRYDFEFALGRDISRTLPRYLSSFTEVQRVKSIDQAKKNDWLLVPTLSNEFFINIRQSAAPTYDLEIVVDVLVLNGQHYVDRVIVKERRRIEVSAFENQDEERTALMQTIYEAQIASLYDSLRQELLTIFNK